jgi:tetratricopeptide (TPR) repeat protein
MPSHKTPANAMEIDRLATQLAKDPQSKAFLPLAEEYCKAGMWEEAVSVAEDGLKYYPGFITAMVVLGRAYEQLNQPTKAKAVLEGAIKLSPENLRAHRILMKIYAAQGLTQESLKSCRVLLSMNPKDEEALSIRATLQMQEGTASALSKVDPGTISDTRSVGALAEDTAPHVAPQSDLVGNAMAISASCADAGGNSSRACRTARIIVELAAWLRSLEQKRRDRPTSHTGSNL